jgi:hypothetical protein
VTEQPLVVYAQAERVEGNSGWIPDRQREEGKNKTEVTLTLPGWKWGWFAVASDGRASTSGMFEEERDRRPLAWVRTGQVGAGTGGNWTRR